MTQPQKKWDSEDREAAIRQLQDQNEVLRGIIKKLRAALLNRRASLSLQ